jgi:phospholipase/carboxylesterase
MTALQVNTVGTTGNGERLLVLVHGYGADEYDLAPLAPHLDPEGHFFTICPRGPHSLAAMGFGAGWYERDDDGNIDPDDFLASVAALDSTIDDVCAEKGFDRSAAVIVGFSQGGAMTLASTLRANGATRPAAIACLSGTLQRVDGLDYLFDEPGFDEPGFDEPGFDAAELPAIAVQHGTHDPLVPIDRGRTIHATLDEHGIEHMFKEYPMQHEIVAESIFDLRDWLAEAGR